MICERCRRVFGPVFGPPAPTQKKLAHLVAEDRRGGRAARNRRIGDAYVAGATLAELAAQTKLSTASIFNILKREGVEYIPERYRQRL